DVYLMQHRGRILGGHAQVSNIEHRGARLHYRVPLRLAAWSRACANRPVPMVNPAVARAGSTAAQGCVDRAIRFSLSIPPQFAVAGWMPRPRKDTDAISPTEYVNRRQTTATMRAEIYGSILRVRMLQCDTAYMRAASRCSWSLTVRIASRRLRAIHGACIMPTTTTMTHPVGSSIAMA